MRSILVIAGDLCWLIAFLVSSELNLAGTTVVVLRGPAYVVLGTDSAVLGIMADKSASSSGCKIHQNGKIFVSAAGAIGQSGGYDAFEIARKATLGRTSVIAIANRFELTARQPFTAYLERFRQENPTHFDRYCKNKDCLQVAFASFDKGIPRLSIRSFFVEVKDKKVVVRPHTRMDCPGTCKEVGEQAVLGVNAEADAIFDHTPHFWVVKGIEGGMEELIGAEIAAHCDIVGRPISILTLSG